MKEDEVSSMMLLGYPILLKTLLCAWTAIRAPLVIQAACYLIPALSDTIIEQVAFQEKLPGLLKPQETKM